MSHTSTIKGIVISDVNALRGAIEDLAKVGIACSLQTGGTPRAYFSNQAGMGPADFVIKLANAKYDVGLYKTDTGAYEPRSDFYGGSVAKELGAEPTAPEKREQSQLGKLFQYYGLRAAEAEARKKGYMTQRQTAKDGEIKLLVTGFQ